MLRSPLPPRVAARALDGGQGFERIVDTGPAAGEFGAGDQVIHQREDAVETRVDRVHIHRDRNAARARDSRRVFHRRGIVAVDVEQPGAGNLIVGDLFR